MPLLSPRARDFEATHDEGAVEAGERDHVADGRQRDEVEQFAAGRAGRYRRVGAGAVDRHQHHEGDAGGAEIAESGNVVRPVGVDQRGRVGEGRGRKGDGR